MIMLGLLHINASGESLRIIFCLIQNLGSYYVDLLLIVISLTIFRVDLEFTMRSGVALKSHAVAPLPWWLTATVAVGALLMAAGGAIALAKPAMLVSPADPINEAVRVYAGYLVSRNLALAGLLLVALFMPARRMLSGLMVLTAIIQLLDAGVDAVEGRWAIVPGVLVFGIVFFIGASRLSGGSVWKAWRDDN
jgi:hypothetical protein